MASKSPAFDDRFEYKTNPARYSPKVLIGNWFDDIGLAEDRQKLFLRKKARGELLVQRVRRMFNNLLREVALALPAEFVTFGSPVQFIAPDMPAFPPRNSGSNCGLALSGCIGEKEVDSIQHFADGCLMSASPCLVPCVRNTFLIKSADHCDRDGQNVKFGQNFHLVPVEVTTTTPLYVRSEIPTMDMVVGQAGHATIRLSTHKDTYCRWRILYWDPAYRPETEGAPFPAHSRVILNHVASNRNVAVEYNNWFPTYFGAECQTAVHTYRDVHRRETAENLWMVNIQNSAGAAK